MLTVQPICPIHGPHIGQPKCVFCSEAVSTERCQARVSSRLDSLEISSWMTDGPNDAKWACCLREYDLGVPTFTGKTQREAINELLDYYEQDNGEIRE